MGDIRLKTCSKCGEEKDYYKDFSSNGKSTRSICKKCEAARAMRHYKEGQELLYSFKIKCCRCGYDKNPAALEFHHIDNHKEALVSKLFQHYVSPKRLEKIKVEMDKCIILCANCHREEHNKDKNRY